MDHNNHQRNSLEYGNRVGALLKSLAIEVLFKATKQNLGLGDYQFLRYRAVERYLHLVMIAHLLLTHLAAGIVWFCSLGSTHDDVVDNVMFG